MSATDQQSYYYSDDYAYSDYYYQYPSQNVSGESSAANSEGNSTDNVYYFNDYGPEGSSDVVKFHYVEPAILVLICIVGVLGNALVIFVIARQKWTKKVTYLYLCNLALVNVLYLLTSVPISAAHYAIISWPFGAVMCKLHGYLTSVFLSASVLTLTVIGVDRYLAVLHPVRSGSLRTNKKAKTVIAGIWAVSFALMTPRLALYNTIVLGVSDEYVYCSRISVLRAVRQQDSVIMLVTTYLLPLLALAFCHIQIGQHLWKNRRSGPESQEVSLPALRERRRVAKIVIALTVAFGVLWLPTHVMNIYEDFRDVTLFDNRQALVLAFSFGANAVNPLIYCLLSRHFRKHFRRALACWNPSNTRNAALNVTRVLEFENTRPNPDEMAVIDLEVDAEDRDNGVYDGGINDQDAAKENTDKVGMLAADKQDSSCSNIYVAMPTQKRSTYIQVTPSNHDSEQESGDENEKPTSNRSKSAIRKHSGKTSVKHSEPTTSDSGRPLITKKLVTFGPAKPDHILPNVD